MTRSKDWTTVLVPPDATILRALDIIDKGALRIALVVDGEGRLLGTVTDGDVRRGVLRGLSLDKAVSEVMNCTPTVVSEGTPRAEILALMTQRSVQQIPVLDRQGCVAGVEILEELVQLPQAVDTRVVLMLGGLGTRLRPLTDDLPKPMLNVGGRPVLETILGTFVRQGFRRFYFCVNYKADVIEAHFGDGSSCGAEICYVREQGPLGTAGALSLLPERPGETFLVMNGDVLTTVDFRQLLGYHREHRAAGTMGVRVYDLQVPYGVVQVDGQRLVGFEEKPVQSFFVNAGIYALEPLVLDYLRPGDRLDMPALFGRLAQAGKPTAVFPVREYWLDMGRHDDYERANHEFPEVFR